MYKSLQYNIIGLDKSNVATYKSPLVYYRIVQGSWYNGSIYMWQPQVEIKYYSFPFVHVFWTSSFITLPRKVTKGSNVVGSNFNLSSKHTTTLGL